MMEETNLTRCVVESPLGHILLTADEIGMCALDKTTDDLLSPETPLLREATQQLEAYFDGRLYRFDLPLHMQGTPFQMACWQALQDIPYGETRTYGQQAQAIGHPNAFRAVGQANHRNPMMIIVPCHRVIGADRSLVGFGGGLDMKAWLLMHERTHRPN